MSDPLFPMEGLEPLTVKVSLATDVQTVTVTPDIGTHSMCNFFATFQIWNIVCRFCEMVAGAWIQCHPCPVEDNEPFAREHQEIIQHKTGPIKRVDHDLQHHFPECPGQRLDPVWQVWLHGKHSLRDRGGSGGKALEDHLLLRAQVELGRTNVMLSDGQMDESESDQKYLEKSIVGSRVAQLVASCQAAWDEMERVRRNGEWERETPLGNILYFIRVCVIVIWE